MDSKLAEGLLVFILFFTAVFLVFLVGLLVFGVVTYGPYWLINGGV